MLQTLRSAWKIEEIRRKILFTLLIVLLYRLGNSIPVPYVNVAALQQYFTYMQNTVLGLLDVMSGGAFSNATIFALSIQPYINASIIIQLLCIAIPALERMSKDEGEEGKKEDRVHHPLLHRGDRPASGLRLLHAHQEQRHPRFRCTEQRLGGDSHHPDLHLRLRTDHVAWRADNRARYRQRYLHDTVRSIISRFPVSIVNTVRNCIAGRLAWWVAVLMYLGALAIIVLIVYVNDAERRIPVQYAKRVVGRKMYGGQSTHLPMKVNMSGVMPIIFAQSIASLPATIAAFSGKGSDSWFMKAFDTSSITYAIIYFLLIIFFAYFYSTIQFNPIEVANNLKKNGGYIPGFRPGKPTSEFIQRVLNKITLFGALLSGHNRRGTHSGIPLQLFRLPDGPVLGRHVHHNRCRRCT